MLPLHLQCVRRPYPRFVIATVRPLLTQGKGINSSIAVWQDVTGKAKEKAVALGVGIGSGYLYETTFEKEVYSDLYGKRGIVRLARLSYL
jgi:ketol-acid reductoisomerase